MKNLLFAFTFLTFLSFQTKAQDDLKGIYVDDIKVSELSCYSFGTMLVAVPYKEEYSAYTMIMFDIYTEQASSKKEIPSNAIISFVKGKYIVFQIFDKDAQNSNAYNESLEGSITRGALANYSGSSENELKIVLWGMTLTGYEEKYYQNCNCIKKTPKYTQKELSFNKIKLNGRKKSGGFMGGLTNNPSLKQVDLTQPCSITGTKVDFNNLGKSGSSSNNSSNTNTTPTNNTPVKAETTVATAKTVITTVAPTSAASVKPLDKTKPGYFEEKSDDKKFMYRNGYQTSPGTYHGEVREYDNNTLEKIITYTNGVEDGLYVIFSDSKVEWAGTYKNGKKDGAWKHYKNGVLEETEKYVNGVKQE